MYKRKKERKTPKFVCPLFTLTVSHAHENTCVRTKSHANRAKGERKEKQNPNISFLSHARQSTRILTHTQHKETSTKRNMTSRPHSARSFDFLIARIHIHTSSSISPHLLTLRMGHASERDDYMESNRLPLTHEIMRAHRWV